MGSQHDGTDLSALMLYIDELENSLAKKDELLAAREQRIGSLEAHVTAAAKSATTSTASASRARPTAESVTPRAFPDDMASSPHYDDSSEVEPHSQGGLSHSLSHISTEDSTAGHATSDGRWNIPFDGYFEDSVKTPPGKGTSRENALEDIGFVPIGEEGRGCSTRLGVTPVKPVARCQAASLFAGQQSGPVKDATQNKENVGRKRTFCLGIGTYRDIS